ncbi:MAG: hypothetical protein LBO06_04095 [Bacteroidales bacterium]|jgi:hypothetical protein|nr:hypothetical protein [Bacteroidales bacterium]
METTPFIILTGVAVLLPKFVSYIYLAKQISKVNNDTEALTLLFNKSRKVFVKIFYIFMAYFITYFFLSYIDSVRDFMKDVHPYVLLLTISIGLFFLYNKQDLADRILNR